MSDPYQEGIMERSADDKDHLIEHLRRQLAWAERRATEAYQAADVARWHVHSDRLLLRCWHAINDEIDDYTALGSVSDAIEEHLDQHGYRCSGCRKWPVPNEQ